MKIHVSEPSDGSYWTNGIITGYVLVTSRKGQGFDPRDDTPYVIIPNQRNADTGLALRTWDLSWFQRCFRPLVTDVTRFEIVPEDDDLWTIYTTHPVRDRHAIGFIERKNGRYNLDTYHNRSGFAEFVRNNCATVRTWAQVVPAFWALLAENDREIRRRHAARWGTK